MTPGRAQCSVHLQVPRAVGPYLQRVNTTVSYWLLRKNSRQMHHLRDSWDLKNARVSRDEVHAPTPTVSLPTSKIWAGWVANAPRKRGKHPAQSTSSSSRESLPTETREPMDNHALPRDAPSCGSCTSAPPKESVQDGTIAYDTNNNILNPSTDDRNGRHRLFIGQIVPEEFLRQAWWRGTLQEEADTGEKGVNARASRPGAQGMLSI